MMEHNLHGIRSWLTSVSGLSDIKIAPLKGDASLRRYYRVQHAAGSAVLMDASKEIASCTPFMAITHAMRAKGLHTPEIIASDLSQGWLLITDFGDLSYLNELKLSNAYELYTKALEALCLLQSSRDIPGWSVPNFTPDFMRQELELFREWFLEKHLQLTLSAQDKNKLSEGFDFLSRSAGEQAQVFMHRDYHSQNLMVLPNQQVGILDFQDAFIGPVTYDVVSLLRDCYVAWPEKIVTQLVLHYWDMLALPRVSADTFLRWFDLMGVQRHLKALLTFSRKYRRDGNPNYLVHVPRTIQYIVSVSEHYPELQSLYTFFESRVIEKCEQ